MVVYLIAAIALMAALAGAGYKGYGLGAASVQTAWDRAVIEAAAQAQRQRTADQDKARRLSLRYEAKIATQTVTNRQITDALQRELAKEPFAADCVIPDGVRVNVWNAANRGESVAAGELPSGSGRTAGATVKQP